jgi:CIC family chloride channel protein
LLVVGHYALRAFAPIVIASVTGTMVSRVYFGDFPAFALAHSGAASIWEYFAFLNPGATAAAHDWSFRVQLLGTV